MSRNDAAHNVGALHPVGAANASPCNDAVLEGLRIASTLSLTPVFSRLARVNLDELHVFLEAEKLGILCADVVASRDRRKAPTILFLGLRVDESKPDLGIGVIRPEHQFFPLAESRLESVPVLVEFFQQLKSTFTHRGFDSGFVRSLLPAVVRAALPEPNDKLDRDPFVVSLRSRATALEINPSELLQTVRNRIADTGIVLEGKRAGQFPRLVHLDAPHGVEPVAVSPVSPSRTIATILEFQRGLLPMIDIPEFSSELRTIQQTGAGTNLRGRFALWAERQVPRLASGSQIAQLFCERMTAFVDQQHEEIVEELDLLRTDMAQWIAKACLVDADFPVAVRGRTGGPATIIPSLIEQCSAAWWTCVQELRRPALPLAKASAVLTELSRFSDRLREIHLRSRDVVVALYNERHPANPAPRKADAIAHTFFVAAGAVQDLTRKLNTDLFLALSVFPEQYSPGE